jgi:hypothetical protein
VLITDGGSPADPDVIAVKDLPGVVMLWRDLSMMGARPC